MKIITQQVSNRSMIEYKLDFVRYATNYDFFNLYIYDCSAILVDILSWYLFPLDPDCLEESWNDEFEIDGCLL